MKLTRLHIRRLPGLTEPLTLCPDPERVTLVIGPNASGKTSLLRALRLLLDPRPGDELVDIEAEFDDDGRRLTGVAHGNLRAWRAEGAEIPRPDWPGPDVIGAWLIRADALLAGAPDSAGDRLADQLRRALAGGLDIDALLAAAPFAPPARPVKLGGEWRAIRDQIKTLEREQSQLADQVDRLEQLKRRRDRARAAQRRLPALQRARDWLDVCSDRTAAQTALAELPPALARLVGDEVERLAQIDRRHAEIERALADERRDLDQARARREALGVCDLPTLQAFHAELDPAQRAQARLEQAREQAGVDLTSAEGELAEARRRLGASAGSSAPAPDDLALDRVELHAERLAELRAEQRALAARLAGYNDLVRQPTESDEADEGDEAEFERRLLRAAEVLRRWLRTPIPGRLAWAGWALLLAGVGAGAYWAWQQAEWRHLALPLAVAAGIPASWLIALAARAWRAARTRAEWPAELAPPRWTTPEVAARLDRLEAERRAWLHQQQRRRRARALTDEHAQAQAAVRQAGAEFQRVCRAAGIDPALAEARHGLLALRARVQVDRAATRLEAQRRRLAGIDAELDRHSDALIQRFRAAGQPIPERLDAGELAAIADALGRLLTQAEQLDRRIVDATRRIDQLEAERADLDRQRTELLARADLAPDQAAELPDRVAALATFRALQRQIDALNQAGHAHQTALGEDAELVGIVRRGDAERLAVLTDAAQSQAEQADALAEQITRIELAREQALKQRELSRLLGEREARTQALTDELDAQRDAAAGRFLLERAQTGFEHDQQPPLLRRAEALLGQMTRGRYRIGFDGRTWHARDGRGGQRLAISELSGATRIQLLLALRLAWIESAERGGPELPLFLDEVLATTDPERYRAVVEALQAIRAEGRQLVYLSSQPADAEAWKRYAGQPQPRLIHWRRPDPGSFGFVAAPAPVCPDPGLDPEQWARAAGIRPLDPWAPSEAMALFHLGRDRLDQLNRLRLSGIETVGEWRHAQQLGLELDIDHEFAALLDRRASGAAAWLARWRQGQRRPVDPLWLRQCDALTGTFVDQVIALDEQLGHDGPALIEALRAGRIKRFQTRKVDELEQQMAEAGLLDQPDPPAESELIDAIQRAEIPAEAAATLHRWLEAGIVVH